MLVVILALGLADHALRHCGQASSSRKQGQSQQSRLYQECCHPRHGISTGPTIVPSLDHN